MKKYIVYVSALLLLAGCDNGSDKKVKEQTRTIETQSAQIAELKGSLKEAKAELSDKARALKELDKDFEEQKSLIGELKGAIKNREVTVEKLGKRTRIRLPSSLVFRSGEAALAASGIRTLKEIAPVLNKYRSNYIEVAGFTDSTPIGPKLKRRFKNNLELSQERAAHVIAYLKNEQGLRHKMAALGYGPQFPAVSNRTKGSRQENRRVIITLVPLSQRPR